MNTIKKLGTLLAAFALVLVTSSSAMAAGNPVPNVQHVTDGTPEGTFAVVYWDQCDADSWTVCRKPPRLRTQGQGIMIEDCDTIYNNYFIVQHDEAGNYAIRWEEGSHEGESYFVRITFN